KNITDTAVANVNFSAGGDVTGSLVSPTAEGTLNYATYATPVNYILGGGAGSTGITGTNTGFTTITGNANSHTATGTNATYLLDPAVANAGSSGGQSWKGCKTTADAERGNVSVHPGLNKKGALV